MIFFHWQLQWTDSTLQIVIKLDYSGQPCAAGPARATYYYVTSTTGTGTGTGGGYYVLVLVSAGPGVLLVVAHWQPVSVLLVELY